MSLINDALKRAQQAQQQAPPPPSPDLQFRPVEPAQKVRPGPGLVLPVAVALAALLGVLYLWQMAHKSSPTKSAEPGLQARLGSDSTPVAPTEPAPRSALSDALPPKRADPAPPAPTAVGTGAIPATSPASATAPVSVAPNNATTNPAAAAEAPPSKPAPLKLQAIV